MRRASLVAVLGLASLCGCGDAPNSPSPAASTNTPSVTAPTPAATSNVPPPSEATSPTVGAPSTPGASPALEKPETEPAVVPATFTQLTEALDFRKIPIPVDAEDRGRSLASTSMVLPGDAAKVAAFVREHFAKLGAKEIKSETPDTPPYISLMFSNKGVLASVFVSPDTEPGKASFLASNHGNVDVGGLPVIEKAQELFRSRFTATWISPENVDKTAEVTRDLLTKAGWREYTRGSTTVALGTDDQRFLEFFQNAIHLQAFISKAPAQGDKTTVQYNASVLEWELPLPPDATEATFGPDAGLLTCRSPLAPMALGAFYKQKFAELGWAPKKNEQGEEWGTINEKVAYLVMQRGNDVTMVEVQPVEGGSTVKLRGMIDKVPDDEKAAAERMKGAKTAMDTNAVELPLPADASEVQYEDESKKVTFKSRLSNQELIDFYGKAFQDAGWTEHADQRKVEATTAGMSTVHGDDQVFVNIFRLKPEDAAQVTALAYGCKWKAKDAPLEKPTE